MSFGNKKQIALKQKQTIFAKEIVTKNPCFTVKQIDDLFSLFNAYCDNRRQCDVQDILSTAKTLGFQKSYSMVYDALALIAQELDGELIGFERFLTLMTNKIGHPQTEEGRRQIFQLCDIEGKQKLTFSDMRKISDAMKYNLPDEAILQIIATISGKGKRDITWQQFNSYVSKKVENNI